MKRHTLAAILCAVTILTGSWAQAHDSLPQALRVVARFLDMDQAQVEKTVELRETLESNIGPLKEEIQALEEAFQEELNSAEPDPGVLGDLAISIHMLKGEVREFRRAYVSDFESLLREDQLRRLEKVRMASRLEKIVPAFRRPGVVPPPIRPFRDRDPVDDGDLIG